MAHKASRVDRKHEKWASGVDEYEGPTEPFLVELMAVRTWHRLNGCVSFDGRSENGVVATIRTVAPAFRMANFLTGVYLIVASQFFLEWPLIFRYDLFSSSSAMAPGNLAVDVAMALWALDFVVLATAYHSMRTNSEENWDCFASVSGYRPIRCVDIALSGAFFAVVAIVGIVATHTVLSHMWQARNVWFATLLMLQCAMLVVASLGDAIDTGSPWGMQGASRLASVLLGLRLWVLVPLTVIFSVASVFASWPPS